MSFLDPKRPPAWGPTRLERYGPPAALWFSLFAFTVLAVPALVAWVSGGADAFSQSALVTFFASRRGAVIAIAGAMLALAGLLPWTWLMSPCPLTPFSERAACLAARSRMLAMTGMAVLVYVATFLIVYWPSGERAVM